MIFISFQPQKPQVRFFVWSNFSDLALSRTAICQFFAFFLKKIRGLSKWVFIRAKTLIQSNADSLETTNILAKSQNSAKYFLSANKKLGLDFLNNVTRT